MTKILSTLAVAAPLLALNSAPALANACGLPGVVCATVPEIDAAAGVAAVAALGAVVAMVRERFKA